MTEQWQELKETITEMRDNGGTGTQQDVCKFLANYMETLEKQMQQPSEDTEVIKVSKGAVKARQGRFVIYDVNWFKEHFYSEEMIYGQPKQPCADAVSREAVLMELDKYLCGVPFEKGIDKVIKELPSVTPQRKRGKWIVISCEPTDIFKCSECGMRVINPYRYCPMCGSYNGGGEDEDGKSL